MPSADIKTFERAAKGSDLREVLSSIAWDDVIRPEITKFKSTLNELLVNSVLGRSVLFRMADGTEMSLSKEQIAGQLYGLTFIEDLFERILRDGDKAVEVLRASGLNYKPN